MKANIEIGELCCAVEAGNSVLLEDLKFRYKSFISIKEPKLTINIEQIKQVNHKIDETYPEVKSLNGSSVFNFKWAGMCGEINLEEGKAWVKGAINFYSFDSFLRIVYSLLAVEAGGFLVHSVGIIKDGKGYIFAGPSGSGKTTIAKLSSNYKILSDEIMIIKATTNGFDGIGTPFYGEIESGQNLQAKIEKLFILKRRTNGFHRLKLSQSEAISNLLKNVLFFTQEIKLNKRLIELCSAFCCKTECEEISFIPNNMFWGWIDDRGR